MTTRSPSSLFTALLKHWRRQRGLSQLDLALTADVSTRHISFLETGRSQPSEEMVRLLATALAVPLRYQNEMLRAAGFEPAFDEEFDVAALPAQVRDAIERLKEHQEPFPLVVMDRTYSVLDTNRSAGRMLGALIAMTGREPPAPLNVLEAVFDPDLLQPALANFDELGRELLWRLKREVLAAPTDGRLAELLERVESYPTVSRAWQHVDLTRPSQPVLPVELALGGHRLSMFTMVTAFNAPQNVTAEELRIESYFPADDATRAFFENS